nr:hypothetical protein [Candidatus Liberibacter asiaticus]
NGLKIVDIFFYHCFKKKLSNSEFTRQALTINKYAAKESVDALTRQIQNLEVSFKRRFQTLKAILTQCLGEPNINNEFSVRRPAKVNPQRHNNI